MEFPLGLQASGQNAPLRIVAFVHQMPGPPGTEVSEPKSTLLREILAFSPNSIFRGLGVRARTPTLLTCGTAPPRGRGSEPLPPRPLRLPQPLSRCLRTHGAAPPREGEGRGGGSSASRRAQPHFHSLRPRPRGRLRSCGRQRLRRGKTEWKEGLGEPGRQVHHQAQSCPPKDRGKVQSGYGAYGGWLESSTCGSHGLTTLGDQ